MPVTSLTTDPDALTVTLVAEFPVPVERLWTAFIDPRQLERFWGPPGYPATFERHEPHAGGNSVYRMTGPDGQRYYGTWQFVAVEEPRSIQIVERFADETGAADESMPPTRVVLSFDPTAEGSKLTSVTTFDSVADLEQLSAIGFIEGSRSAMEQLDRVLADLSEYALGKGTVVDVLDDTLVRITRAFEAPLALIWRAHTEPELLRRWMLGPDGWTMTACEFDLSPGGGYRYAWAPVDGTPGEPFGFEGENVVIEPQRRLVSTERMSGAELPGVVNDLSFVQEDGVTLLTLLVTYVDAEQRDAILATGMADGMEASYARLERELVSV